MFGFDLPEWLALVMPFLLACLTLLTSGSLVGLLAIWVALGRPHWFLRVAAWAGVVLPLLLIPAFEPVLLFSIQTLVAVVPLAVARGWLASRRGNAADGEPGVVRSSGWRLQYHLQDLLLLTLVVAVATAVAVAAPADMWGFWNTLRDLLDSPLNSIGRDVSPGEGWALFGLLGLGLGISTIVAAWVGLSRRRWLRLAGPLLVPNSALMAAWLLLLRASNWLPGDRNGSARAFGKDAARAALALLSLAILAPPLATFVLLISPAPKPPQIVLPNPNGYDDLRRAGKSLLSGTVPETGTATDDEFVAFSDAYNQVLNSARAALDRPCAVPLEFTLADIEDLDRLQEMRQLGRALRAEGGVARIEGRPGDAAACYLDEIRLEHVGTRDALAIDWLVGLAIEGMGLQDMAGLREDLDAQQCREAIDALLRIDADRERLDDVWARDEQWGRVAFGNAGWVHRWISMISPSNPVMRSALGEANRRNQAHFRMLLCALALRADRLDHGELPATLADLVPEYLPAVPLDPFSGKPLVYRPQYAQYKLYSVGDDGCDNGGNAGPSRYNGTPGTDILLDPPAPIAEATDDAAP